MEKSYDELLVENNALQEKINSLLLHCQKIESKLEEQLKIEEQLSESRARFSTIFHQSNVAHKIINQQLEIVEINEALSDLLGYSRDEILGTRIIDYTHPDFKDYWTKLQDAIWQGKVDQFQLEACLIRKDRSEVWVIVHTILFKDDGVTFGYTLLEDITSRKQLERHKDDFISVISHELKTPMTSLKIQCEIMARHLRRYEDGHADKMMTVVDKQISRLTRLINNLVLVSKIESSKLQPELKEYCLDNLVEEVVSEINLAAPLREIHVDLEGELLVKGDPDKIYQVVYNLLTNAIKFSKEESKIDLTVKRQHEWAVACIQDYGQGIPKESLDKVFERFYKVETNCSHVQSGVGLGLYISSEIINHQNGKLWVDSEPDKGSMFCFSIPAL